MTIREVTRAPGPPWDRELEGRLDKLVIQSELLKDNPLGDPATRPLYVYMPPGVEEGAEYPTIYLIQGLTGQVDMWFNREFFQSNMIERLDELFADDVVPRAIVVMVDAVTSYGGSQFINSAATGPYMDYLCDEVVAFIDDRYPTINDASHRGLTGKSSGGYGAMVVPMLRSDVFNALASHAGDALFEVCYEPEFRETVRTLRDKFDGSFDVFWDELRKTPAPDFATFGVPLNTFCMAACYSPDLGNPGKVVLPFDIETGRLIDDVWARWLEWDPVRMVPDHVDDLKKMKLIHLESGKSDEWYLDLGALAVSKELDSAGIDHHLEFFDGKHGNMQYRYPGAIKALAEALAA